MLLLKSAKKKGLNGIAITDHNCITGALKVKNMNKDKNFEVIVGEEVSTDCGHLLAYNINQEIKLRAIIEVIEEIKNQGGLAVYAHPFRVISFYNFLKHFSQIQKKLDAIETLNGRSMLFDNILADRYALNHNLTGTGGSDAHFAFEIGSIVTEFDNSFEKAIKLNKLKLSGYILRGYIGSLRSSILALKTWKRK